MKRTFWIIRQLFFFLSCEVIRGYRGLVPWDVPMYRQPCFRSRKRCASATGEQRGKDTLTIPPSGHDRGK